MAFPVGYELLQEHFSECPHWLEAVFHFSAHPTTFASEFTRILREQEPYLVFRLEYRFEPYIQAAPSPRWHFTIYPVPGHLKSVTRNALVEQSFPTLRDMMSKVPVRSIDYNRWDVIFDPVEGRCQIEQWRKF